MSNEAQKPQRSSWKIIIVLSLFSCILSAGYLFWDFCYSRRIKESHFHTNQEEPTDVAETFLFALADKRIESMKDFVVEEKWEEAKYLAMLIDGNLQGCKFPWDPDHLGLSFSSQVDATHYSYGGWTNLNCDGERIILEGSVELVNIDGKWFVQDWLILEIGGPSW